LQNLKSGMQFSAKLPTPVPIDAEIRAGICQKAEGSCKTNNALLYGKALIVCYELSQGSWDNTDASSAGIFLDF